MDIARGVLERYPRLRSSWPIREASAWRLRQARRAHPRRMASWCRDMPDMHTRLFVSNLEVPEAPELCESVTLVTTLLGVDLKDLIPKKHRKRRKKDDDDAEASMR